jgi:hypothetical protein
MTKAEDISDQTIRSSVGNIARIAGYYTSSILTSVL